MKITGNEALDTVEQFTMTAAERLLVGGMLLALAKETRAGLGEQGTADLHTAFTEGPVGFTPMEMEALAARLMCNFQVADGQSN